MVAIKSAKKVLTTVSPSGIIEQQYIGVQDKKSVSGGVTAVRNSVEKLRKQGKEGLLLVNLNEVQSTDQGAHIAAIRGMKSVQFKKLAIYGPLKLQILLNTLAIVADKHHKVRVFDNRLDAVKWLRQG